MRIVGIQRIGQQCTISDTEERRSWRDRNTPTKPETKDWGKIFQQPAQNICIYA